MKVRVNLYSKAYAPKLEVVSLPSLLSTVGIVLGVMVMYWLIQQNAVNSLQDKTSTLKAGNQQLQQQVDGMQAALAARKPDAALQARVKSLQLQLKNQQLMLKELASREGLRKHGFAALLTDLAAQHQPGLWLELIEVDEQDMRLYGSAVEAQAVPQWLTRLTSAGSFKGKSFDTAKIYRTEENLKFELDTSRAAFTEEAVTP